MENFNNDTGVYDVEGTKQAFRDMKYKVKPKCFDIVLIGLADADECVRKYLSGYDLSMERDDQYLRDLAMRFNDAQATLKYCWCDELGMNLWTAKPLYF